MQVVFNAWGRVNACKESLFEHLLSDESQGVWGYLCHPPIDDIICLVVPWCLSALVVGIGYHHDELIELYLGVLVTVAMSFVPI